jgi:hypothetical protein
MGRKAIPVQAWTGPEGSRRLRLPDFKTTHEGGKIISPTQRPPLARRKYTWYSILLEAESTSGPISMKNSNDTIGYWTRNLPACSAVLQSTALQGIGQFLALGPLPRRKEPTVSTEWEAAWVAEHVGSFWRRRISPALTRKSNHDSWVLRPVA